MKQLNRCPNCGALLPKSRTNTVKCEYSDSVFENIPSNEPLIIECDDKQLAEMANALKTVRIDINPYRDEKGRLHASQQTSATSCVAPKIQFDAGHFSAKAGITVTHFAHNETDLKTVMDTMKDTLKKHGYNFVEVSDRIDDSYRLPDTIEKQWKVRCFPW